MAKFYQSDATLILRVIRDHINTWDELPMDLKLEDVGKSIPSMMIQQLASIAKKRKYVNGTYVGVFNFAVYVAIDGEDTASRIDALAVLNDLGEWLSARDEKGHYLNLPDLGECRRAISVTVSSSPSIASRQDNGVEEYQALFALEYMAIG